QRRHHLLDAGVVEGKIKPGECRQRLFDHHFDIALFRDVGFDEDRFAAQGFDLGDDVMAFLLAASTNDDLRAVFGKLDCGGATNTGIAASNQCDFSCKFTHKVLLIELIDYHVTVMVGEETECFSFCELTAISASVRASTTMRPARWTVRSRSHSKR